MAKIPIVTSHWKPRLDMMIPWRVFIGCRGTTIWVWARLASRIYTLTYRVYFGDSRWCDQKVHVNMDKVGQDLTATLVQDWRNLYKQETPTRRITSLYLRQWIIFDDTLQWYRIVMCMLYHYFTYGLANDITIVKYPGNLWVSWKIMSPDQALASRMIGGMGAITSRELR